MRTVYIADDGKEFSDEFECQDYEWRVAHPHLKEIKFIDKDGNELEDYFSEDVYGATETLVIPSKDALEDLHALEDYTGFCAYETPDSPGVWLYSEEKERFVKSEDFYTKE